MIRTRDIAPAIVSRRRWVLVGWAALLLALLPQSRRAEQHLEVAARIPGSQAAAVEAELALRFHSPYLHRALLVTGGLPVPDSPEGHEALRQIVSALGASPHVRGTLSFLDTSDPIFVGRGGSFVLAGVDPGKERPESLVPPLRELSDGLVRRLRTTYPHAYLGWTGELFLNSDIRRVSAEDARAAELRILPVTLPLLLVTFGSVVAALLPVATGVIATLSTLGAAVVLARVLSLSILIQSVATMIGLGLGIDYALLMVSRFREQLNAGDTSAAAAVTALRKAGHTLVLSAFPVAIGFAALLTVPISELRSIGIAGMLVTAASLLLSVTLLPGLLAWLGRAVDRGRFLRGPLAGRGVASERYRAWGLLVVSYPKTALLVAGLPLAALATQAARIDTETLKGDWLPRHPDSVVAYHRLEEMGHANLIQSLRLLVHLPSGAALFTPDGWTAASRLTRRLQEDPRIERVHSLPTLTEMDERPGAMRRIAVATRRSLATDDFTATVIEALPAGRLTPGELLRLARDIRSTDAAAVAGLPGVTALLGGLPEFNAEYQEATAQRFSSVVTLVVGVTLVSLFTGFRSVLVAVKAVALNLLSVGASFGALVLVFQDGHGARLLGLDGPTGGVFPIVPVLVFCIVFGLSMDYEVILVARVAEARASGLAEKEAIAEGLARTGGLITSAATIMMVVFASFAAGAFLPIKMLGFTLFVAVLLDATVVRMVIGPALLRLAGAWNWWPGGLPAEAR